MFAKELIEAGAYFGPYKGVKVSRNVDKQAIDTSYMWEVMVQRKVAYYIDGKEEKHGNWMRWINCARVCCGFDYLF